MKVSLMKDFNSYRLLLPCRQITGSWHILYKKDQSAAGPEIENLQVSWKPKKKRTEGRKEGSETGIRLRRRPTEQGEFASNIASLPRIATPFPWYFYV